MSFDDDLRRSLRAEAGRYDPADDGADRISSGVRAGRSRRHRVQAGVLGATAVVVVVAAIGLGLASSNDPTEVDAGPVATEPSTTETTAPATTTSTPPTTEPADDGVFPGIWPFASQEAIDAYEDGDARFEDPAATADAFARDYLGMLDPVVGEAVVTDDGSHYVDLRPRGEDGQPAPDGGPLTRVGLRSYETSYGARIWTVVGAASPNVVIYAPGPLAEVNEPLTVRGEAIGYEGTVIAQVRQDGMRAGESLGDAFGIAAQGEMTPFELEVPFSDPTEPTGALVVHTDTGLDGVGVPEATVIRLAFSEASDDEPSPPPANEGAACVPPAPDGEPGDDEMDVTVFFICEAAAGADPDDDATFVPVTRRGPRSAGVLQAAMETYLGGATDEEEAFGVGSFTYHAAIEVDVMLESGTAVVDIDGQLVNDANGASTSAGSLLFRGALNRTVFQFSTVDAVEYRIDGSCEAFWEWQQVGGCPLVTRDDL